MRKILTLFLLLVIAGCEVRTTSIMTRAEVITAVKECTDAGLNAEIVEGVYLSGPLLVNCKIKEVSNGR